VKKQSIVDVLCPPIKKRPSRVFFKVILKLEEIGYNPSKTTNYNARRRDSKTLKT
jgi:hypothetical protein